MKGYGLDQMGDHDQAILSYTAALRLDPTDDEILIRRAVSLARVGDRPAALPDLQAVERLKPSRDDLSTVRQFVQESSVLRQRRQSRPQVITKDQVPSPGGKRTEPQARPTPKQVISQSPRN
jgi:tetratricopeptide (TPR) repeat protein